MRFLVLGLLFVCLARVHAQQQQQAVERTTGNDVTEEEPHPYTISFFLFPRQQTIDLPMKKNHSAHHDRANKTKIQAGNATVEAPEDDIDQSFQHGSIKHPAHEMYPMCHHCEKNSTYEQCTKKSTVKRCDKGLSNICYTRSIKRNKIVHYEMGCADHKKCQMARSTPCRAHEKRCFTCCQWSRCNSQPHHGHYDNTAFSMWNKGHVTAAAGWTIVVTSLLPLVFTYLL